MPIRHDIIVLNGCFVVRAALSSSAGLSASRSTTRSTNGYGYWRTGYVVFVILRGEISYTASPDAARNPGRPVRLQPQPQVLHIDTGGQYTQITTVAADNGTSSARHVHILSSQYSAPILRLHRVKLTA